jgi:uncharacterized protein YidB (DUF937 family)
MSIIQGILGSVMGSGLGGGTTTGSSSPLGAILGSLGGSGGIGGVGGRGPGAAPLLSAALGLLQQSGGLQGMLAQFQQSGLGAHADSWVGTGPNLSLSPQQLEQTIGAGPLAGIASQLGLAPAQAGSAMSQILPELINQMTPHGQIPAGHHEEIAQGLAMLRGGANALGG